MHPKAVRASKHRLVCVYVSQFPRSAPEHEVGIHRDLSRIQRIELRYHFAFLQKATMPIIAMKSSVCVM